MLAQAGTPEAQVLSTDAGRSYEPVTHERDLRHAPGQQGRRGHRARQWARDDADEGVREVHCNNCEEAGPGVRHYLWEWRGVPQKYLAE